MNIAAISTVNSLNSVKQELSLGLLKKSLDINSDFTSQLFTKVLEGSLEPHLGKNLDIRV